MDHYPMHHWLTEENVRDIIKRYPETLTFFKAYSAGVMDYSSMLCCVIEVMFNYYTAQEVILEGVLSAKHAPNPN